MAAETLRQSLNRADPNTLADMFRSVGIGDRLRIERTALRSVAPTAAAANPSQLATLATFALPEDAKASTIGRAYARTTSASGTLGELTIDTFGTTPIDGHIAVAPNGDIVVLASSGYTNVDVEYTPQDGDIVASLVLPVSSNAATIPAVYAKGTVTLMAVTATTGTVGGAKIVLVPQAGNPATGKACLNVAKSQISFATADALTSCTVDILVAKGLAGGIDANAALEGTSQDV